MPFEVIATLLELIIRLAGGCNDAFHVVKLAKLNLFRHNHLIRRIYIQVYIHIVNQPFLRIIGA